MMSEGVQDDRTGVRFRLLLYFLYMALYGVVSGHGHLRVVMDARVPVMYFCEVLDKSFDKRARVLDIEDTRPGFLLYFLHKVLDLSSDAAGPHEDADQLSLIISDGELAERAGVSADDDNDVGATDVDDLSSHEPAARINYDIVAFERRMILIDVLPLAESRGYPHDKSACSGGTRCGLQGKSRAGARDRDAALIGDCAPQFVSEFFLLPGHHARSGTHHPDLQFHFLFSICSFHY